jgi:bifunctional DNA-binding transcriptional regulator/antitoxin component of YhaV-PrlF toxin-antitoxin module
LRRRLGLREGDEVDVVEDGNTLRIVPSRMIPAEVDASFAACAVGQARN